MCKSADGLAVVLQFQSARRHEAADDRGLDILALAERLQSRPFIFGHGQDHPFLGFADPDFGVRQPFVFERGLFEPNFGADLLSHLADRARKAAGPAIGHRVKQPSIAGLEQHIEHHLFGDRVADLHRAAASLFAFVRQFDARKRRAVNAIAARAAADGHDRDRPAAVP